MDGVCLGNLVPRPTLGKQKHSAMRPHDEMLAGPSNVGPQGSVGLEDELELRLSALEWPKGKSHMVSDRQEGSEGGSGGRGRDGGRLERGGLAKEEKGRRWSDAAKGRGEGGITVHSMHRLMEENTKLKSELSRVRAMGGGDQGTSGVSRDAADQVESRVRAIDDQLEAEQRAHKLALAELKVSKPLNPKP
jgi:hypothetical protein